MNKFSTLFNLNKKKPAIIRLTSHKIVSKLFLNNINKINQGGLRVKGFYKHKSFKEPLITIITVVKNNEKYLEETIKSVLAQKYKNIEYLVIDGDSKDKTKDYKKIRKLY